MYTVFIGDKPSPHSFYKLNHVTPPLPGFFTKTDELLLNTVAVQSGIALHRAQLYQEETRSKKRNTAILQVLSLYRECLRFVTFSMYPVQFIPRHNLCFA